MKHLLMHKRSERSCLCSAAFNGGWMKERQAGQGGSRVAQTWGKVKERMGHCQDTQQSAEFVFFLLLFIICLTCISETVLMLSVSC